MSNPLLFLGIGVPELLVLAFFFLPVVLWVVALIDVLRSSFRQPNDKLIWVVVVILLPVLGALLYFGIGRSQRAVS
ncbi:MAG: PLDc N-terminal domain-containing protein [Sphingobacteriaceae bacterium]|nr:PLDc N-terminal domain-containing protein [Cytophagaceae bacterium]